MVAYNFKPQFVGAVERGEKTQTIRRHGKRRHAGPGDVLQLYTGMRTKKCRLLMTALCLNTWDIEIYPNGVVYLDGERLDDEQVKELAQNDGFGDIPEFLMFFGLDDDPFPFEGVLIKWESLGNENPYSNHPTIGGRDD